MFFCGAWRCDAPPWPNRRASRVPASGTTVADRLRMAELALAPQRFLHVTWLEVAPQTYYLVARCDLCDVVVERELTEVTGDGVFNAIGIELLGAKGCVHVSHVVGSGLRLAVKRR